MTDAGRSESTRRIAILEPGYSDYDTERRLLSRFDVEIRPVARDEDAGDAVDAIDPSVILVRERAVTRELMTRCPSLKAIVRYGVGVDSIDLDAARERRVYVANVPDYGAEHEVSDHAVALYLAVARRIVSRDADTRRGVWGVGQAETIHGHRGATLGLVGFGKIARKAREKFMALGFERCLVSDPALSPAEAAEAGVEACDVDALCRESDVVSLHAPLNEQTRHVIDARRLALMKPASILVNVSRGGLVDESALAAALSSGALFGAGIDVFENEPPPQDGPLMTAPNTVISDHNAWYSEFSVRELQTKAASEVARIFDGDTPLHWVNPW